MRKKDVLTKASQQNMVCPKLPSLHGVNNSVKNALEQIKETIIATMGLTDIGI